MNLAGELLERAARATPATVEHQESGWWLRHTEGNAWWHTVVANEIRLLERVGPRSAYITVSADGEPIAIGRAVADDGWTGVFGMATTLRARRRGAGRSVLSAIARWACRRDAPRLYLQVERSNTTARRVYAAAGFTEIATYHYRVKDARPEAMSADEAGTAARHASLPPTA